MAQMVLVDDTDGGISYSGPWFVARNTLTDIGNFGPPFQQTLHGVNTNASLSYTFSGTSMSVLGTSQVQQTTSGVTDPSWSCILDGSSIPSKDPILFAENSWVFCEASGLSAGSHTIELVATVRGQQSFWFDRIQYTPTSDVNLNGKIVYIDSSDSRVVYGNGWQGLRGIAHSTQTTGATVTFSFTGTQLTWYGFIPGDFPSASAQATYSVDGGTPTSFLLKGLSPGAMELYNQIFFQTPTLSGGQHTVTVTHQGNGNQTPLTLEYFVIIGGGANAPSAGNGGGTGGTATSTSSSSAFTTGTTPLPTGTSSGNSSATSSGGVIASGVPSSLAHPIQSSSSSNTSDTLTPSSQKGSSIGPIIGGALGALALIVFLVLGILFLRRRRRNVNLSLEESEGQVEPFQPVYTDAPNSPPESLSPNRFRVAGSTTNSSLLSMAERPPSFHKGAAMYGSARNITHTPSGSMDRSASRPTFSTPTPPASNLGSSGAGSAYNINPFESSESAGSKTALLTESVPVNRDNVPPTSDLSDLGGPPHTRFLRHEDSGVRLPPVPEPNEVVELPPEYTPG